MAITVTWDEYNGQAETKTASVSNVVFGSTDDNDFDPMKFPIRADAPSFVKYIKATFVGIIAETISLTKFYISQGAMKTGETLKGTGLGPIAYAVPTQTAGEDSALPTSSPGSQNVALGGSDTGTLVADGSTDYIRLQRTVAAGTPTGALMPVVLTLEWTET